MKQSYDRVRLFGTSRTRGKIPRRFKFFARAKGIGLQGEIPEPPSARGEERSAIFNRNYLLGANQQIFRAIELAFSRMENTTEKQECNSAKHFSYGLLPRVGGALGDKVCHPPMQAPGSIRGGIQIN